MTKRLEFSRRTKAQAFARANGACEMCGARLSVGKFDYDHRLPAALGGGSDLDNCVVACRACHGTKTATEDVPRIAKTKRQHAAFIGAKTRHPGFHKAPPQRRASKPLNKWYGWKGSQI